MDVYRPRPQLVLVCLALVAATAGVFALALLGIARADVTRIVLRSRG